MTPLTTTVVVGTGLAGIRAAETLRGDGYDGRLILVGQEPGSPYDRPPLSKQVLLGEAGETDIALLDEQALAGLGAEWRTGTRATAFDPDTRQVRLSDGESLTAHGLVIATGVRARRLPGAAPLAGVHVLRTLPDALGLREDLKAGGRLVVVGGGFIGCEVASAARRLGVEVTLVETDRMPLGNGLGEPAAALLAGRHADNGVRVLTGRAVRSLRGGDRVGGVVLDDGAEVPADTVLVGIGAVPDLAWPADSGIACSNGVLTDAWGRTNVPGVVAAGDVANYTGRGGRMRVEHWTNARDMPVVAARALLAHLRQEDVTATAPHDPLPYVWSDQYGSRIQFTGLPRAGDHFRTLEGDRDGALVAVYERAGRTSAVLAVDAPRPFTRLRGELRRAWAGRTGRDDR